MKTKEEIKTILNSHNNDFYRKTIDTDSSMYVFDNSIDIAKECVIDLASNILKNRHIILAAQMQSGKTSVMNSIINLITQTKLDRSMAVKKYILLTGMNDCGLKTQTYERLIGQVVGASKDTVYTNKRSKKNETLGSNNKFFVLKNSDLKDFDESIDNSIIFIDEAHYGSNAKNKLTQFLENNGIDWKNSNALSERNIYIVSISATDFTEMVSDTANNKNIIELKASDDYVGISDYLDNDLIYKAEKEDISEEGEIFEYIKDAKERMDNNNENGVVIIRTRNFELIKENNFVKNNFDIFEMFASGSNIQYNELNSRMEALIERNKRKEIVSMLDIDTDDKPLMVLIKGAYRAGITLPSEFKDIIYMIYDNSTNAAATCQALLGRMCGYRNGKENIKNTKFYINKDHAIMYSNWSKDLKSKELIPSDKYTYSWTDNDYCGNDVIFASKCRGNFAIELSDSEIRNLYKKRSKEMKVILPRLFQNHGIDMKYDYFMECCMSGKNNYAKSSQEKRFNSFAEDLMVFPFRPSKIKEFPYDTLNKEHLGQTAVSVVLDADIYDNGSVIGGNKRLLVYNVEVGQKRLTLDRRKQYQPHKDTSLV